MPLRYALCNGLLLYTLAFTELYNLPSTGTFTMFFIKPSQFYLLSQVNHFCFGEMRVKRVATLRNDDEMVICRVLSETKDGHLSLSPLNSLLERTGEEPLFKRPQECVKVILYKNKDSVVVNYDNELRRAALALRDLQQGKHKRPRVSESSDDTSTLYSGTSPSSSSSGGCSSGLEKRRLYSPSLKGSHDVVKADHNQALAKEYNSMMQYYNKYNKQPVYAVFLDSEQLVTQSMLTSKCSFSPSHCLVPNPYEYDQLATKKTDGVYNMTLGAFLTSRVLCDKTVTFAWFDYMNSLDGNVQDKKAGESSPREDIEQYLTKWAKPYTLFAVTLCLRHSKYTTHDYTGGTEVVIMRYINDTARQAGFYFSIVPPTCSYGSSMFIYAGILLPLQE